MWVYERERLHDFDVPLLLPLGIMSCSTRWGDSVSLSLSFLLPLTHRKQMLLLLLILWPPTIKRGSLSDWHVKYKLVREGSAFNKMCLPGFWDSHEACRRRKEAEKNRISDNWVLTSNLSNEKETHQIMWWREEAWMGGGCIDGIKLNWGENCVEKNGTESEEEWWHRRQERMLQRPPLLNEEAFSFQSLWPLCYSTGDTHTHT